jgi:hypothetical protein
MTPACTVPTQGGTYWNGEAMQGGDYNDLGETSEAVASTNATVVRNAVHLANLLREHQDPASWRLRRSGGNADPGTFPNPSGGTKPNRMVISQESRPIPCEECGHPALHVAQLLNVATATGAGHSVVCRRCLPGSRNNDLKRR